MIEPGHIVKLKSGGPRMTIRKILGMERGQEKTEVVCDWFEEGWPDQKSFFIWQLLDDNDRPLNESKGPWLKEPIGPHPDGEEP